MSTYKQAAIALCLAVLVSAAQLWAQSRKGLSLSRVGEFRHLGQGGAAYGFSFHSYGLGGLQGSAPSRRQSLLQSRIGEPVSFSLGRALGPARTGNILPDLPAAAGGIVRYETGGDLIRSAATSGLSGALTFKESSSIGAASAYAAMIAATSTSALDKRNQPITSLVPQDDSLYAKFIAQGEKAFKDGNFREAYNQFQFANHIGGKDPESLLSLAHASFAKAMFSYGEPALRLRQALRYLPELPLAPLRPKAFYGAGPEAASRYAERTVRLAKHVEEYPLDADAHLLMAYFQWFSGQAQPAAKSLSKAMAAARRAKDRDVMEALNIFRDGMVRSGKAAATLRPGTQPAAASGPAAAQPSAVRRGQAGNTGS